MLVADRGLNNPAYAPQSLLAVKSNTGAFAATHALRLHAADHRMAVPGLLRQKVEQTLAGRHQLPERTPHVQETGRMPRINLGERRWNGWPHQQLTPL